MKTCIYRLVPKIRNKTVSGERSGFFKNKTFLKEGKDVGDPLMELAALLVISAGLFCVARVNAAFTARAAWLLMAGFVLLAGSLVLDLAEGAFEVPAFYNRLQGIGYALGTFAVAAGFVGWSRSQVKMIRDLKRVALLDELTGLYNRRGFLQRFREEIDRSARHVRRLGILMIDLDNFKAINDRYGHIKGDAFLVDTASIIKAEVRASDIVARIGGDEFACILVEIVPAELMPVVKRIKSKFVELSKSVYRVGESIVGISVGAAVFPEDGRDIAELISIADKRMYEDKKGT